jgi:hypothetical protein
VLPFRTPAAREFILDLQFEEFVVDIGHAMLGGVFEGEAGRGVLIVPSLSGNGDFGEVALQEGAIGVAEEGDGGGLVLNFKLVGVIPFYWQVCQLEEDGRVIAVADRVLSVADLEDQQAEQKHRSHFEWWISNYKRCGLDEGLESVLASPFVLVVEVVHGVLLVLALLFVHGVQPVRVDLLLRVRDHLQQLLLPPVPLYLRPLPFVDLLPVAL